jgi:hypothetical protein
MIEFKPVRKMAAHGLDAGIGSLRSAQVRNCGVNTGLANWVR